MNKPVDTEPSINPEEVNQLVELFTLLYEWKISADKKTTTAEEAHEINTPS